MKDKSYTNEFDKPVYKVNNAGVRKNKNGLYELQLNNEYFEITEDMLRTLADVTYMSDNVGISIG